MKYSAENVPDWLSKCAIQPSGENFLVTLDGAVIPAFIEPDHPLHSKIKAEYERRQKDGKK